MEPAPPNWAGVGADPGRAVPPPVVKTIEIVGNEVESQVDEGPRPSSPDVHGAEAPQVVEEAVLAPQVGMVFNSEAEAYEMYNNYAGKAGFSIRKSHTKYRADKTIYQKWIVCSNQGTRGTNSSHETVKENAITRSCCSARVQFSICRKSIWTVQKVVLEHNHYLASPNKIQHLRSQRRMVEADKQLINQIREAGAKPTQVYEFFKQWYGGGDNVPFSRMDCNNEIGRKRRKYLAANDAQSFLEYLKNKQLEDPNFFYAIQLDPEDGRLANFFWADGQSINDYACFGDVVSFDTTFQTNKFEMPFAPILGVNHHRQTILFGAALLYNETVESFDWLFRTFLVAMSHKQPSTIFTDQDAAMAAAIHIVFENTSHRLCVWHIYQNAAKHLSHVMHKHPRFLSDLKSCVYEENSVECFDRKWNELLASYELQENTWLKNIYGLREKWALIFRDSFTAEMTTTQRSEGMNNVFKKRFRRKLCVTELIEQCEKVVTSLRENELEADFRSRHSNPVTYIHLLPMLKTAAESYTRRVYSDFEEQFKEQFALSFKLLQCEGTSMVYKVMPMCSDDEALVVFDCSNKSIKCSCRKYECSGLLCKHALRVFNVNGVFDLPSKYILTRWTKYAKREYCKREGNENESLKSYAARLARKATSIALRSSVSRKLLDDLDSALDKLELDADNTLSLLPLKSVSSTQSSDECFQLTLNENVSFRVPPVRLGKKRKQRNVLQKKNDKSTNMSKNKEKGKETETFQACVEDGELVLQGASMGMSYTNLLLGVSDANQTSASRALNFDDQV